MGEEDLSIREFVCMNVFEIVTPLKRELEMVRKEVEAMREALGKHTLSVTLLYFLSILSSVSLSLSLFLLLFKCYEMTCDQSTL